MNTVTKDEKDLAFGEYIRKKRLDDPREITLLTMATQLGISMTYLSDIENRRKRPLDSNRIAILTKYLNLSDEDSARVYDLASKENSVIPADLEDVFMHEPIGDMARLALRQSKAGNATEEDWKQLIRAIERNKAAKKAEEGGGQ
jgi:transcriptional regulator with XRE-family HTH domain